MTFTGITNHVEKIPGSTVTACLAHLPTGEWYYTLWNNYVEGEWSSGDDLVATGEFWLGQIPEYATPNQIARIAFLLEVEYKRS